MSAPKPRIRPKPDPSRAQSAPPMRDPSFPAEHDPPVFSERDYGAQRQGSERVVFHEDDCLR